MKVKHVFKHFVAALLTAVVMISPLSMMALAVEVGTQGTDNSGICSLVDKVADGLDASDCTNVTLRVPGDLSSLGVDIIYILGSFVSRDAIETSIMISCLRDTIGEIVATGIPVNFGMVPFSSTKYPVMALTPLRTEEDLAAFPDLLAEAIQEAGDVYDQVNMENALITAKRMFSESPLASHPERQHLVMISSGHTYFFNSGENNEYVSTVPVSFAVNGLKSDAIFYMEKAWMRARNNDTNSYPIPYAIYEKFAAEENRGKWETLWNCYWYYIDQWAKADVAAGDTIVYDATTVEAGDFKAWFNSGMYHPNQTNFKYSGYGAVISEPTAEDLANTLVFNMNTGSKQKGPNPFTDASAAHAISYERAMWEAYNYVQEYITGTGIRFYPIYQKLRANNMTTNGYHSYYDWTDQYIGHSFMNMLAGGEAVVYSSTDDKAFFAPIKEEILYTCSVGSTVEDYIGYEEGKGNFEFVQDPAVVILTVGGVPYVTAQIEARNGADFSLAFTKPDGEAATFWLDYYYGNGTTTERFVWTFGENVYLTNSATLTYKLQLTEKTDEPSEGYVVPTNNSAVLYPKDSDGEDGEPQMFPVPEVIYDVQSVTVSGTKIWDDGEDADGIRPESITIRLYANGEEVASKVVTAEDGWAWSFDGLRKFEKGVEIVYTISEDAVEGYEAVVDGFHVTNVHVPEEITDEPEAPETGDKVLGTGIAVVMISLTVIGWGVKRGGRRGE